MSYEDIAQQRMAENRKDFNRNEVVVELVVYHQGHVVTSVERLDNTMVAYDQVVFGHFVGQMAYDAWKVLNRKLPPLIPTQRPSSVRTSKAAKPRSKT